MNLIESIVSRIKSVAQKPIFGSVNTFGFGGVQTRYAKRDLYYGTVYSCIDAIATNTAAQHPHLKLRQGKNEVELDKHPIIDLLRKPNPYQTGGDLMYLISAYIDAFGKAFLYPVSNTAGVPVELWVLDSARMRTVGGKDSLISGYVYQNPGGKLIPFEPNEIIAIDRPNPFNQLEGISTIEMARYEMEADYNALKWNRNFFDNGAQPSGVLSTDSTLNDETFERVKKQWHDTYDGVKNAHKTLVLEGGLKWMQVSLRQKDMEFVVGRTFSRDQILSIFKVPKTILAITDDVNRANAETSDYVFASRVIEPRLSLIYEKLNMFFVPKFKDRRDLCLEYDDPVPENEEAELNENVQSVNRWRTVNEIRADDGLEPLPGGDVLYYPMGLMPVDSLTDPTTPTNEPKGFITIGQKSGGLKKRDAELIHRRERHLRKQEQSMKSKLKQHYKFLVRDIQKKSVEIKVDGKKTVQKAGVDTVFYALKPDFNEFKRLLTSIVLEFGTETMKQSIEDTAEVYDLGSFELTSDSAIAWLKDHASKIADEITSTLQRNVREIIADELTQQETTLEKIKNRIADELGQELDYRTDRIARTELITAYNRGSMFDYKESGVVDQVKWITAGFDVCEDCIQNEEEGPIPLGDSFPSGDTEPAAHPNCRCSVVPYFGV